MVGSLWTNWHPTFKSNRNVAKPLLTIAALKTEATEFSRDQSRRAEPSLFGVTDGKAIGTHLEQRFHDHLEANYEHQRGSSSQGRDLPGLDVDLKSTSIRQPQSSCPYQSATQKIYGLGYSLLVFVYDKSDDELNRTGMLQIVHAVLIDKTRTADFQTTIGLQNLMAHNANEDDIVAFLEDRRLPVDEIESRELAKRILREPPEIGYLTISNALQWRLQFGRVVDEAGRAQGIDDLTTERKPRETK
jgi:hypothetical protein